TPARWRSSNSSSTPPDQRPNRCRRPANRKPAPRPEPTTRWKASAASSTTGSSPKASESPAACPPRWSSPVRTSKAATRWPCSVRRPGTSPPQLLTLQELQGPGISAKGASFAGLSFYVLLGRGQDYAWSATTASQDIIDTYAVELCEPDGSPATKESNFYEFHGECVPFRTVERYNAWEPNLGDDTPSGSYRLVSYRTHYGPVTHRATIDGKPVAYTTARSTFLHEVDSIIGFQK